MTSPETRYAKSGDVRIAYQVIGNGPIDLVFVPGFLSNLDVHWEDPGYSHLLRRLGTFTRLIQFDKRGTGLSDRVDNRDLPSLETRMDDVRAVMDAAGSGRAALLGASEGAPMAILFAATYPERTRALVLYGGYAHFHTWVLGAEPEHHEPGRGRPPGSSPHPSPWPASAWTRSSNGSPPPSSSGSCAAKGRNARPASPASSASRSSSSPPTSPPRASATWPVTPGPGNRYPGSPPPRCWSCQRWPSRNAAPGQALGNRRLAWTHAVQSPPRHARQPGRCPFHTVADQQPEPVH